MLFLETDLAFFKRLTGAPLDSAGRPVLSAGVPTNRSLIAPPGVGGGTAPSYGVQIPLLKQPFKGQAGLTSQNQDALRPFAQGFDPSAFRQVPVFDANAETRNWEDVWPCVTFQQTDVAPGAVYIYHDPFGPNDPANPGVYADPNASVVNITNRNGDAVMSGYSSYLNRVHPDQYDVYYTIRYYAKSRIEAQIIESQIMYLFPRNSALLVDWMNGDTHPCDMFMVSSQALDVGSGELKRRMSSDKVLDASEQAHYSRSFTYRIEAYFDNTQNSYGVHGDTYAIQAITQRILELATVQNTIAENSGDQNLQELVPVLVVP